jgi:hypothetical protein
VLGSQCLCISVRDRSLLGEMDVIAQAALELRPAIQAMLLAQQQQPHTAAAASSSGSPTASSGGFKAIGAGSAVAFDIPLLNQLQYNGTLSGMMTIQRVMTASQNSAAANSKFDS